MVVDGGAGDQLGALRFYLDEEILFLKEYKRR